MSLNAKSPAPAKSRRFLAVSIPALAVAMSGAAILPSPIDALSVIPAAHARGDNPCAPASRGANPCAPASRGANPCAPASRGANPCAPASRGANPCAPASRGANPCAPGGR
ncbi:MAG: hypothetical protein JXK51_04705 [Halothiobacillaceae bacterium]|nr:hypothetical protein [Halothiobacillaceae bacterium]